LGTEGQEETIGLQREGGGESSALSLVRINAINHCDLIKFEGVKRTSGSGVGRKKNSLIEGARAAGAIDTGSRFCFRWPNIAINGGETLPGPKTGEREKSVETRGPKQSASASSGSAKRDQTGARLTNVGKE